MSTSPVPVKPPSILTIERILCPVDFSEFSAKAYDYALSLAHHYRAKLFLEHVVQPITSPYPYYAFPDSWSEIYWNLDAHADTELKQLVQTHRWNGVQPDLVVHRGPVPASILSFADVQSVDLIVMGTHGRQGLDRLAMGSVTEKLLRKARCPVLVVRKPVHDFVAHDTGKDPVRLRRVLLCTDFSEPSERALKYALSLAMEYNSELTLLHVLEQIPDSAGFQQATSQSIERMQKLVSPDADKWCSIRSVVRLGKPYQEIVQFALEAETDLIVMGVRGRNTLDIALFGSTAHRVIQLGSCPVLAVHV
jgi:nucleotide-binding universal stress UspA family protein